MNHPALGRSEPVIVLRGDEARSFVEEFRRMPLFSLTANAEVERVSARSVCGRSGDPVVIGVLEGGRGGRSWWIMPDYALAFHEHSAVGPVQLCERGKA